ncbi:hypothetical protein [Methylibium sp.]|uniref:hypothetical protein n=1 Tax=Methylibium sp. TaxID=2067992 RepID=UPI002DB5DC30|nr:hypothetical protein [Methylibium sp.]
MDLYRVLGVAVTESLAVVTQAWRRWADDTGGADWAAQFSESSNDDRRGRRRVEALFRGATVRL